MQFSSHVCPFVLFSALPGGLPSLPEGDGGLRRMDLMAVDTGEDEWRRLHDVRLTSNVLEYVGRGKCLVDVGLAQARTPIGKPWFWTTPWAGGFLSTVPPAT